MQEYIVKENPRARRVIIKMTLHEGLVVVVPRGFDRTRVPALLRERREWIDAKAAEVEARRGALEPEPPGAAPSKLLLRSLEEEWSVEYLPAASGRVAVTEKPAGLLLVSADPGDQDACARALHRWLGVKTHREIVPRLEDLAEFYGFVFNHVSVRSQRTRWASCSTRKNVSLNLKLLFLPEDLVRYVLVHELCHTVHFDHSPAFWELLSSFIPHCRELQREMRDAWIYVPAWLEAARYRPVEPKPPAPRAVSSSSSTTSTRGDSTR